jgi:hypothetical protein
MPSPVDALRRGGQQGQHYATRSGEDVGGGYDADAVVRAPRTEPLGWAVSAASPVGQHDHDGAAPAV